MRLVPSSTEGRAALGIGGVLAALLVITLLLDALVPSPGGPRSSSFATAPDGIAAWADLARRSGREVRALRERWSDETLPAEGTVVVLDPDDFTRGQARALRRFAEGGGRVVAGGRDPGPWIGELARGLEWERGGDEAARVLVPAPETGAAASLRTRAEGHWERAGGALPVAAGADGPIVLVQTAGEGRIALVADPSPLQNRLLDDADNAALALALAGPGPVTFVESVHGYGEATGLAALPARFRWGLILLGLSGLLLIAARWRRLGPPEPPEEPLFPPRRAYVDALAATLARSRDRRSAVESVRSAARERLARRAALPRDADAGAWAAAARAAGLDDDEARALLDEEGDDGIAAGRALAQLSREGRRA
jgi:Domain of unknown function (DUF4350)